MLTLFYSLFRVQLNEEMNEIDGNKKERNIFGIPKFFNENEKKLEKEMSEIDGNKKERKKKNGISKFFNEKSWKDNFPF